MERIRLLFRTPTLAILIITAALASAFVAVSVASAKPLSSSSRSTLAMTGTSLPTTSATVTTASPRSLHGAHLKSHTIALREPYLVATPDIALGMPVTASSQLQRNPAPHADDGDLKSRWTAATTAVPQWIQIDLGSRCDLTSVTMTWYGSSRVYQYRVDVSDDGTSFVPGSTRTTKAGDTSMTETLQISARYVRVVVLRVSSGRPSLYEVAIVGSTSQTAVSDSSPAPTPEPSPGDSAAPSPTSSPTLSPAPTPTPTDSGTATPAPSDSPTVAPSPTPTTSDSPTASPTPSDSPTATPAPSDSPTPSPSPTPSESPSPVPTVTLVPSPASDPVVSALLARRDLIYGSEIGAWHTDGKPAVDPTTPIPSLVKAAKIPLIRFAVYDAFSDMTDPTGAPGTQSRAKFDAAIDGIRNNLGAEIIFKLLPITRDTIGTKPGTIYVPPLTNLAMDLPYDEAVIKEAGPRIRIYESSNEIEYDAYKLWGFPSAGAPGLGTVIGEEYAATMPVLKKYARSLGFNIIAVGYMGTAGGFNWGDSIAKPRLRTCTEFMTAVHNAYVASGYDPDYIPDAVSFHAYPYGSDFPPDTPLSDVIAYYDALTKAWRAEINRIWGPEIGPTIKLACTEWNAGDWNSSYQWSGFLDQRVNDFYTAWLAMLRRNDYWLANQFAIASNSTQKYDIINTDGTTSRQYDAFKAASLADPVH
jgi:hypothetical protein